MQPLDSSIWIELARALPSLVTAITAVIGVVIGARGLNRWRAEAIGKRKAELAEAVLADFYRIEEIFRAIRAPFVMIGEQRPKEGVPNEIALDEHFVPVRRMMEYEEFLGHFRVRRHEFAAVFGKEAAAPFEVVRKIQKDIHWATGCLLRHKEVRASRDPGQAEQYEEWRRIIFQRGNDEIARQINEAVDAIEATCRPAIESMATKP